MDELAQELVDHIIDDYYALADRTERAMESCGLVSKRWLRRSRYHLFSRVTLSTGNLRTFVDLIEMSPLELLPLIRQLKFEYVGSVLDDTLLARLHRCSNLTSIEIYIFGGTAGTVEAWLDSQQTHLRSWSRNSGSL
ncbi:hypothetical protein B0H17DRAFT_1219303 [Mycena rosella]|uniref:Uncharacterized protein n=1 Tax=Mycena rosella TaxID=1033263 RepID=A0AAD7FI67_MYCRO|nr:hypothetical protein B0H17DRAFT_1219303 [Mycena rosella]